MDLVGAWRRRALSAAGAGASVPVLVVSAGLLVGVGGGGIGGLGSLSQAFSGPDLPAADLRDDRARPQRNGRRRVRKASRLLASVSPRERGASPPTTGGGGPGNGGGGGNGGGEGPGGSPPSATPPPVTTPPPTQPRPEPPPEESVVRQVGDQVTAVTDPAPIVGPTAREVVDTLVATVDELPPLP